mgnify:CR=1 FL=1
MNLLQSFFLPPAKSTVAADTDALFTFIHAVSLIFLIGIVAAMVWFVYRYRRRSEHDVTPVITHNNALEVTWSVIPFILVMIVFAWGFRGYLDLRTPPADAYEVRAIGKKWLWEFHYENGYVSVGELHVPAGRPVKLVMNSVDVIHSFYVPDYRIKRDVLPGRYSSVWFEAPEAGESIVFCTEYCGTAHSDMMAKVVVKEPQEFQDWLSTAAAADANVPPVELGGQLVQRNACLTCHSQDGSELQGPTFKGIFGREQRMEDGTVVTVDENYIRNSILRPQSQIVEGYLPVMPPYEGTLNDTQIDAIIEYLKTVD